jgi:hypothetical protein
MPVPLLRPAASAPPIWRQPGGAIVRAASPGGLIQSARGAVTPWVQRIKTGVAAGRSLAVPAAAAVAGPAAGLGIGIGLGGAILRSSGAPGTAKMSILGGDAVPKPRMGSLPTSARVPSQYPAGVSTGVGGGNAGASTAPPQRVAPRPTVGATSRGGWAPAAQGNPRLPAGRNVAIVNPPERAQNRALNIAAQNAGLPAMRWEEGGAEFDAAKAAGEAAAAARASQGGRGYLSMPSAGGGWNAPTADQAVLAAQGAGALGGLKPGATTDDAILMGQAAGAFDQGIGATRTAAGGGLPDTSNPATQAYWDRADIQAWANASDGNRKLAQDLQRRSGFTPASANVPALATAAAAAPSGSFPAESGRNWSFSAPAAGQMQALAAQAADQPNFNKMSSITGGDFRPGPAPVAAAPSFQASAITQDQQFPVTNGSVLPGGAPAVDDAAQARLQDYLQRIKNLNPTEWNWNRRAG